MDGWLWTPLWCRLSTVMAVRSGVHPTVMGLHWAFARRRKERTYPELVGLRHRARLVVLAGEVVGRWSHETQTLLRFLAKARARGETALMKRRAEQAWRLRWSILCCAAAKAFDASLLELRPAC